MPAKSGHVLSFRRLALLFVVALLAAQIPLGYPPAFAQDGYSRYNVFRQIFRPFEPQREQFRQRPQRRLQERPQRGVEARRAVAERRKPQSRRSTARAAEPPPENAAEQPVEKLENARTVLVVGDFLASGLAESLETVFAQSPGVEIADRTNGSSGFVRNDFYDWPAEIKPLLEAETPAAVVVMIGSNDRQQIKADGASHPVRSEAWTKEYEARIEAFASAVTERNIPLIWVGMPAFRPGKMSSDMLAFNDIYRRAAEQSGGTFVDIWDGFVDENGAFVTTGPDINGQPVQLRGSDGINMTRAGKRKVAFYVEKPLNRILGNAVSPGISSLEAETAPEAGVAASTTRDIDRTPPISLTDPELDGGTELLGAEAKPKPNVTLTPAERLAVEGIAPAPKTGRADDFTWRKDGGGN